MEIQLAICLNRLGHYGNSSSAADIADWAGVSVGNTELSMKWCMLAILSLHDSIIRRGNPNEKEDSKKWVESCICPFWQNDYLIVDGTNILLFQCPSHYGETFYDRESRYSLNAQVIYYF